MRHYIVSLNNHNDSIDLDDGVVTWSVYHSYNTHYSLLTICKARIYQQQQLPTMAHRVHTLLYTIHSHDIVKTMV